MALSCAVILRLHALDIDIAGRHAADLDDVCFSAAAACLLAGSYASSPASSDNVPRSAGEGQGSYMGLMIVIVTLAGAFFVLSYLLGMLRWIGWKPNTSSSTNTGSVTPWV